MIFEIILLVLIFGSMFFLILKATKKIFETIFIVLGIFILFSCGILGLGYLEFKKISSYEEIDLNIYYGGLEDLKFGVSFSFDVEEKEIDTKNVEVLTDLDKQSVKDLEENEFSILITKKALENILPNGSKYDVLKIFQIEELKDFDLSFSKEEILQILDENSNEKLKERVAGKIPIENEIAKKFISSGIELAFENSNLTSSKFALGLIMTNERVLDKIPVLFLEEFKNKNIQIYPDKILFKMIRILPIKKIVEKVQDN